jgi:hypothetical protein
MNEHRITCSCHRSVLPENWHNHTLSVEGTHIPLGEGVNGLTVEEAALLDRLDDIEEQPLAFSPGLRDRIETRLAVLATGASE